jgi:hypothetical protein
VSKVTEKMKTRSKPTPSENFNSHPLQGVSEISALILTGNRTNQTEQLFSLPFWRKTLRKKLRKIFLKPFIYPKLSYLKT